MITVWLFILLGTLSLFMGTCFFVWDKGFIHYKEAIYILSFEAAIIFFTALIVERLLLKEFSKKAVETVEESFGKFSKKAQDAIDCQIDSLFELLRNARYNGIVDILPPRRDSNMNPSTNRQYGERTFSRINDSLKDTEHVKIFCISGRGFLGTRLEVVRSFWGVFLQKVTENAQYKIRILLADPKGYGAEVRGQRENPKRPAYIGEDIRDALIGEKELKEAWVERQDNKESLPKWSITIRFYNFIPQTWAVITDKEIFIEPYQLGKNFKSKFPNNFKDFVPCSAGRLPIFVARRGSTLYEAFDDYFDWLWEHNDPGVFNKKFAGYFNVIDEINEDNT